MVAESVIWPDVGACWPAAFAWPCPLPLPLLWAQAEEKPIAAMSSPTRSLARIIDLSRGFVFPRHWPNPKPHEHTALSGTREGASGCQSNRGPQVVDCLGATGALSQIPGQVRNP